MPDEHERFLSPWFITHIIFPRKDQIQRHIAMHRKEEKRIAEKRFLFLISKEYMPELGRYVCCLAGEQTRLLTCFLPVLNLVETFSEFFFVAAISKLYHLAYM